MNGLIGKFEKMTPFFDKVVQNKYMSALMAGFMGTMYIIIYASIFMMITYIPNTWGFFWPDHIQTMLLKPYDYTMGFLGVYMAGAITRAFVAELNKDIKSDKKINEMAAFIAALTSYFIVAGDPIEGGISTSNFDTSGLFLGILIAFVTGNIYKVCIEKNITIKLPDSVPPTLSVSFASLFAYGFSVGAFVIVDIISHQMFDANLAVILSQLFSPLFSFGDSYFGLIFMFGMVQLLTFVGIHGTSMLMAGLMPIMLGNLAHNMELVTMGEAPTNVLTMATIAVAHFGGSGATLMVAYMFAFLAKSKKNKVVGKAALIPTNCQINEPILFGGPIVLNPYFLIPFITTPVVNVVLYKFFIENLGLSGGFIAGSIGIPVLFSIPMQKGFQFMSFVFLAVIIVVDFLIYYPFFKAYDQSCVKDEMARNEAGDASQKVEILTDHKMKEIASKKQVRLLVLCAAGGTSGLLANAVKKAANKRGIEVTTRASAVVEGRNEDVLKQFDLVVLAPQAASHYDSLKQLTDSLGVKLLATSGKEYIELGQNPDKALDFVLRQIENKD